MSNKKWKTNKNATMAIKGIENRKGFKYVDKILEQFTEANGTPKQALQNFEKETKYTDNVQSITFKIDYLRQLVQLAKGMRAESIDLIMETDKPMKFIMYPDSSTSEDLGIGIICPIKSQDKLERRRTKRTSQIL